MDDQPIPSIGYPLRSEGFACARSTEQVNAHKTQVVRFLKGVDKLNNLPRSHRGAIDSFRLRHSCIICGVVRYELELFCHSHD